MSLPPIPGLSVHKLNVPLGTESLERELQGSRWDRDIVAIVNGGGGESAVGGKMWKKLLPEDPNESTQKTSPLPLWASSLFTLHVPFKISPNCLSEFE